MTGGRGEVYSREWNGSMGVDAMTQEELRTAVRAKAADGKVPCKVLLDLAVETGAPPAEIGRMCNELGIKVHACQLGCFK